jgi:hypothetical protein
MTSFFSFFLLKLKKDFFFFLPPRSDDMDPESDAEQDSSSTTDGLNTLCRFSAEEDALLFREALLLPSPRFCSWLSDTLEVMEELWGEEEDPADDPPPLAISAAASWMDPAASWLCDFTIILDLLEVSDAAGEAAAAILLADGGVEARVTLLRMEEATEEREEWCWWYCCCCCCCWCWCCSSSSQEEDSLLDSLERLFRSPLFLCWLTSVDDSNVDDPASVDGGGDLVEDEPATECASSSAAATRLSWEMLADMRLLAAATTLLEE